MALQQIKERGALPMIDRGDIRQAPTVAAIFNNAAGRWLWSVRAWRIDSLIAKFKEGRNGQTD